MSIVAILKLFIYIYLKTYEGNHLILFGNHDETIIRALHQLVHLTVVDCVEQIFQTVYAQHFVCHFRKPFKLVSLHRTDNLQCGLVEHSVLFFVFALNYSSKTTHNDRSDFVHIQIYVFQLN